VSFAIISIEDRARLQARTVNRWARAYLQTLARSLQGWVVCIDMT
jgi:hypothetical protein